MIAERLSPPTGAAPDGGLRFALGLRLMPGVLALFVMLAISVAALIALALRSNAGVSLTLLQERWFWHVLRFSLWQALLSAVLSLLIALPLARALALDRHLPGRTWFLRLCLLCFVMPSLVLITGLVTLFGRSGWITPLLGEGWQLYGLPGILIAHVYLNAPFAIRVLSQRWQSIPVDAWKISAQLGLNGWQRFRLVEWPMLRTALPGVFGFVFLLCFNSFAVVLALGGGPRATTLEVAIFQALKFDFNPPEALFLACMQLVVAGSLFVLFSRWGGLQWLVAARAGDAWRPQVGMAVKWGGRALYAAVVAFLSLPIVSLVPAAAAAGRALPWPEIARATVFSVGFALAAALLAVALALAALSLWRHFDDAPRRRLVEAAAVHHLVIPGMVLSVGVYVLLMARVNWLEWGWVAIVLLNALMALPFVFVQLRPSIFEYDAQYRPLLADLGLQGWHHWRRVLGPFLAPVLRRVAAIAFVLALGDFAVFGIYGNPSWHTLPWMIHALAGSYRLDEAAAAALLLLAVALAALCLLERARA